MSEILPVPTGGAPPPAGPDAVLKQALAMAAVALAAEQQKPATPVVVGITRDEARAIAREELVEVFRLFGVNLDRDESVEAHQAVLNHARASRAFWSKAAGTILNGIFLAIAGAIVAAFAKYTNWGPGK